ncbi:hypothetical protein BDM02DRAFT_3251466 [Thelephora ganbajun]|uniref:Uncharacterized protein n=1 Tax=Thelephora ganbajun TaxID=370292 RepID=A0ACB6ZBY4_THEGA|nr:hypothetical protein BDM02DRAFT_3251466 [Thelephora ganbajun]
MPVPSRIADVPPVPSLADLRELTLTRFHRNACNFQLEFAQAVLEGKKHVLLQAGCGMGKTLGFWIPLLAWTSGSLIVVTPLTLLGDQHDIGSGVYHVIVTSPEQLMKEGGGFCWATLAQMLTGTNEVCKASHKDTRLVCLLAQYSSGCQSPLHPTWNWQSQAFFR